MSSLDEAGDAALRFLDVTAGYGGTVVLRQVSFAVRPGQVVALLGPNGAGKTTALRAATGIVPVAAGRIELAGLDARGLPPYERARAGLCHIPEGRGIFRNLTVRDNVRLHLLGGTVTQDDALERVLAVFPDLAGRLGDLAGRLSGGQQQMLALARAYVTDPKVVLLDEVSMGLAPRVVEEVFAALGRLAETGVAMLLVEQYVTRAMQMADKVVLLNKGAVAFDGSPSQLDEQAVLSGYLGEEGSRREITIWNR